MVLINQKKLRELIQKLSILDNKLSVAILSTIGEGECCASEISVQLKMPKKQLLYRIALMREAGYLSGRKKGRVIYYKRNTPLLLEVAEKTKE